MLMFEQKRKIITRYKFDIAFKNYRGNISLRTGNLFENIYYM